MSIPAMVGAVDIGSHTAGLAVCRLRGNRMEVLRDASRFTRLGEGLDRRGHLAPQVIARTVRAVSELVVEARGAGAIHLIGGVTSPGRRANNPQDLVSAISGIGIEVRVLGGVEEAELTWEGVHSGPRLPSPPVVLDIGGGSTEVAWRADSGATTGVSLPTGVVRIRERFWSQLPPSPAGVEAATAHIRRLIAEVLPGDIPAGPLVGVAGTPRSLAWLQGLEVETAPVTLPLQAIEIWSERLLGLSQEEILALEPRLLGREHILAAGVLILRCVMEHLRRREVLASGRGLRHGLAWRRLVTPRVQG